MTNKLTLTEQEELFAKDCKLINLKYEYNGYAYRYACRPRLYSEPYYTEPC